MLRRRRHATAKPSESRSNDDVRRDAFVSVLNAFARPGPARPRLLDLACGHGTFSLIARDLGWDVVAVDARTKRMPMSDGIEWIQSDVRDFTFKAESFDLIACLGLLYHLELADQIDLLQRCAPTATLVDTHVSLNPRRTERGYEGEDFDELQGRSRKEHHWSGTASWKNHTSFWVSEPSLIKLFHDCGFASVFKLEPVYREDRTFWLCLGG